MHGYRYGLIFLFICLLCSSAFGGSADDRIYTFQDHHKIFGKNNISLSLAPLFVRGFEVNYDRRIVEKHWVKLAPVYFRRTNFRQTHLSSLRQVEGYGFKFQHKYFPYAHTEKKFGLFLAYGPTFQRFDTETHERKIFNFDKFGLECVIGARQVFFDVLYFEMYAGLATNYIQIRKDETENWRDVLKPQTEYDRSPMWFDYGKTGNYITLGFNVGILF